MDELAQSLGFEYTTASADIVEQAIRDPDPRRLVLLLAHAKADAIIAKMAAEAGGASLAGVLITCDQVVVHEGNILEKPADADEVCARAICFSHLGVNPTSMRRRLSMYEHHTVMSYQSHMEHSVYILYFVLHRIYLV